MEALRVPFTQLTNSQKNDINISKKEYRDLCQKLNSIKFNLENILVDQEDLPLKFMIEFMDSPNPELFIKRSFVELKNVSIPGIRLEALISSDLLDIDTQLLKDVIDEMTSFKESYQKARERFKFEIAGLYIKDNEDECGVYDITKSFEDQLNEFHTGFATTDDEVKIVISMQTFVDSVNNLINLGLIRCYDNINWLHSGPFPPTVLSFDSTSAKPISLNKNLFRRLKLGMYSSSLSRYRQGVTRTITPDSIADNNTATGEVSETLKD